ncbi:MAG TPA: hypothetical protein VHM25_24665 [Polyangiaceae bacterium]|jgi:hypothetical protein|nr:hypothetical protein [Polyangiaceae bacterium]
MIDTKILDSAVQDLRNVLRDGLVATDIWDRIAGLSLAGFNQQPVAVALFTRITTELESSLTDSNFPPLARYYLLDMEGNHTVAVINHGALLQGILVDNKRANLGILISVAIPRMLETVARAQAAR